MKKCIALLLTLALLCVTASSLAENKAEAPRVLVAYLSRAGENYNVGETHEGSGQSGTQSVMEKALPDSTVLQGLAVQGKTAQENEPRTRELIAAWLDELNWK